MNNIISNEETVEMVDEGINSIVTQNPLTSLMSDDDPFGDEFNNE